ncbi:hypothetical protein WMY93_016726 [Mugilogobius chulae]|uniref:Alstrom syndrome protein 1 n=1 Tax=Mugilogobius chulae TaxID=88201 RepID=A0AAW0NSQ1_9GOBI
MDPLQRVLSDEETRRLQDQRQQRLTDSRLHQMDSNSPHFAFQDSNMSPALSLLPSDSGMEHNTDYSLFQQSDMEFAPLRAIPDMSVASEKFHVPPHEFTSQTLDQASLSQHPLASEMTVLSEEAQSSCGSLSQHSLSPERVKTKEESEHLAPITEEDKDIVSKVTFSSNLEKVEDTYFLNKDVPAQQLMQILQKHVGVPSSSSSSSRSSKKSQTKELKSADKSEPSFIREGPQVKLHINKTGTRSSDVFNVSVGPRYTKPDDSSEALRQELLDIQRRNSRESGQEGNKPKTPKEYATPFPSRIPKLKHLANENVSSALSTGSFSTGIPQRLKELREQELWSPGNQTGIDGSYLGFLPQSQSTPGVFKAPLKSGAKAKFQQLSDIESNKESSIQASVDTSSPSNLAPNIEPKSQSEEEPARDKVQSLPSLNYMQKVDAWRTNQGSGKTSLFDSLALQGFTGVSPKKKAYDAVSDSLNRILSQQVVKMNPNAAQNLSADVSAASSPRREEAVGSAPSDNIATTQSASPFNRSQSHSSLSTVVMSEDQHQNIERGLSPIVVSLGQFSDVTLSNSQDSSNSGQKVATSVGTSSVSLEVDNYDPYWNAKLSTPPPQHKPREFNIEERIPVYLQNLGISQSPSTILTPFAPRGPIREPEFSPTELATIKGSTPTKSIQPSEGGTPHKAEFSRSSLQSMDSSVSVPLSLDIIKQDIVTPASYSSSEASGPVQSGPKLHRHLHEDQSDQQKNQEADKNMLQQGSEHNAETSFVSSGAFSDIRKLLSQADDIVSPRISAGSDRFLSLRKEATFTPAFTTEESKSQSSHLWTRSSSDSVLTTRERLTGGENVQSARQSGVVSRSAGLSLVLNKSVQRAEPEGCSAAPPDGVLPQPQVQPPPTSAAIATTEAEESKESSREISQSSPAQSSTSSPVPVESVSDRSSESSLAIRVAKLLQTESPATMVSSTNSVDQEEGRAREWIKQMISGQKCEPLELDQEDRRRIEEIKREMLLKNPKLGYASTDTESSAASSLRDPKQPALLYQKEPDKSKIEDTQPALSNSVSPTVQEHHLPKREDVIETKIREIAAREGVSLPNTKALTSITISTSRRSTSPSPSTSPAPSKSPASEPLHVNQLTTENETNQIHATLDKHEQSQHKEIVEISVETQVLNEKTTQTVRQDTVGGHSELSPASSMNLEQEKTKKDQSQLFKKAEATESSKVEQVTAKSGHVSQVRLLLSPKPMDHSSYVFSRDVSFRQKHFVPLRHSPSTPSSPDEGVGLSSPPEWQEVPKRGERYETNRRFTQQQRVTSAVHVSPKPLTVDTTMVPHLLPYKPSGSEELFYVPQTEADSSNDTTMESTHTGSDDALPPRFSSDVLGHQDPGLDRGVTIRHTEGIYSKRLTKPGVTMSEQERREAVNNPSPLHGAKSPKLTSPSHPSAFTYHRAPHSLTQRPGDQSCLLPHPRISSCSKNTNPFTSSDRTRLFRGQSSTIHLQLQHEQPGPTVAKV